MLLAYKREENLFCNRVLFVSDEAYSHQALAANNSSFTLPRA